MILSTAAIVLRTYPFGDTSRIAVLLTRDHGKIRVIAKGVRSPRSRIGAALELFSELNVMFYDKRSRDLQLLKSADPLRFHPGMATEPARLAFGSAAVELLDLGLTGEEAGPEFHALLSRELDLLETAPRDRLGIHFAAFQLEVCALLGYEARFDACPGCDSPAREGLRFLAERGALVCTKCCHGEFQAEPVSPEAADWLRFLNGESSEEPAIVGGDRSKLREAARFIQLLLHAHLPSFRGLKSLEVLKRLEIPGGSNPA